MIPYHVIDQINEADIVSIIEGEGVELKKSGVNRECCCPFHGEKTPSFKVSVRRNMYKCFGCGKGGGTINFIMEHKNMTFYEAAEYLAKKENIEYEKKTLTPEEHKKRFAHSQLLEINKVASEFFREQLKHTPKAQEYNKTRGWGKETLDLFMVGYAPNDKKSSFYEYAKNKGYNDQVMLDAGLIKRSERNGELYDTFRERIVFPVYSRTGNIIAFSGRHIGITKKEIPKFLNTAETELYTKSDCLFGYFQSYRVAKTSSTIVLVEGNPDVIRLHQIGVENAVAPLGTALTSAQINLIKQCAKNVVIIGDTDEAGVAAVHKNGLNLLEAGLNVRVMILTNKEEEKGKPKKTDPDEYFRGKTLAIFNDRLTDETIDYITWICDAKMAQSTSTTEQATVIAEICKLLTYCPEETISELYLEQFSKKHKNKNIWTKEYTQAKNEATRKKTAEDNIDNAEMTQRYGFYEKGNCYFGAIGKQNGCKWSNFILTPIVHVIDERNAKRMYKITNENKQTIIIKFAQKDLISLAAFRLVIESRGNFLWFGGENEMMALKRYLYDDTPSAIEITQLGYQPRHSFFAWGNGGFDDGCFVPANECGLIDIKGKLFYVPGCSLDTRDDPQGYIYQRKFLYLEINKITLNDYAKKYIGVFGDQAKVGLAFLIATLFRDIIFRVVGAFPLLNYFGPKGTGKTQCAISLTKFFVTEKTLTNVFSSTKAAISEAIAEVCNGLVLLDEYKDCLELPIRELLKGVYDGAGRDKMNMDNDKKKEQTRADSGVILCGQEMTTADIALFTRVVLLTFYREEFSLEEQNKYKELKLIEGRGLTHLTGELLKHRSTFQGNFRYSFDSAMEDLQKKIAPKKVMDRILKNWATCLAAFKTLEKVVELPFDYNNLLEVSAKMCLEQQKHNTEGDELSEFWEVVDSLVGSSKIWQEVDYHIKPGTGAEVKITESKSPIILDISKEYLYINLTRILSLYSRESRSTGGKAMPRNTLKRYLEKTAEFVGTTKACRFKVIENSQGFLSAEDNRTKSRTQQAMIFDYTKIQEKYNINIDISSSYEDDTEVDNGKF